MRAWIVVASVAELAFPAPADATRCATMRVPGIFAANPHALEQVAAA